MVIDPDDITKREYFKYETINANSLETLTRGLTGSAAGAVSHDSGAPVRQVFASQALDDIWLDLETAQADIIANLDHGGLTGLGDDDHPQYGDHGGLTGLSDDDHPQYLKPADHDDTEHAAINHDVLAGLADDDHTQYYNQTRGDARYERIQDYYDGTVPTLESDGGAPDITYVRAVYRQQIMQNNLVAGYGYWDVDTVTSEGSGTYFLVLPQSPRGFSDDNPIVGDFSTNLIGGKASGLLLGDSGTYVFAYFQFADGSNWRQSVDPVSSLTRINFRLHYER
jgi:hypothetical protein